jgi:glycosyltransferase involved in cell wall biosynthesis
MDALASCDLFVFPSPAEGFPKVVLDAMAAGLPVVATASGELADPGRRGLIEPTAPNGAAVAAAIERLAALPERAVNLRNAGTTFARAHTGAAEAARLVARWATDWPVRPRS